MATIDELTVEVNAESKQANDGIDALSKTLLGLQKSLKGLENIKLDGFKNAMKSVSDSVKALHGIKDLSSIAKSVKDLSKISESAKSLDKIKESSSGLDQIKASIDTKDFDSAVEELQKRFKDSGTEFEFKGNSDQLGQMIKNLEKTLDRLYERQDEFRDLGKNINTEGFIRLQRNIAVTSNRLGILKEQLERVNSSSGNATISRSVPKLSLGDYRKELAQVREDIKSIADAFGGLANVPKGMLDTPIENLETSLKGLKETFPGAISEIDAFEKELEGLKNVASGLTRERIAPDIDTSAIGKIEEASRSVENVRDSMKEAGQTAEQFEEYLENIRIPEIRETNLEKLRTELERTERKLDELTAKSDNWAVKGVNPDSTKFRNLQEQIVATSKKADALRDKMKEAAHITPEGLSKWQKFGKISSVASEAFGAIKKAASGTIDSVKKIGRAFSDLLSVIKKVSSAVGKMFSNMASVTPKVLSAITAPIKGITSAVSRLKGAGSEVHSISSGFSRLASAAAGLAAAGGIASFGKNAIELGSDITEVENVVDTAFGAMADKAYEFAETATEKFGLSELAAKNYAGTMMSMLRSSNVTQKEAANMAVNLAGLAGDIASFYNIDTDVAFQKLRSGMSGQTAAMKQLGINMNIANLEAYALANGITKSYREMTIAEQTALRYNYIMDKSRHIQGDFAKTAGTFANQLRLLKLNIQSIAAIIGQGLIAAILPAIKMLNKLMEKLMQAAKVFRDFMYVLFGKKIETPARGVIDDMGDMEDFSADMSGIGDSADDAADGIEDTADSMDDATSSAKKLKKALSVLPFDQLNQLTGDLDYGTSKNKGKEKDKNKDSKLDDLGIGDMSGMFDDLYDKKEIEPVNKWAAAIRKAFLEHDWEGLGKTIALMTNKGLRKIYDGIKKITPKVESALRAFATTFNSFVKWLDWDLLGRTVGSGINLLSKAFNALTDPKTGIDFVGLGKGIAKGVRGLLDEVNWTELGNAIGNGIMVVWRLAKGIIDEMWRKDDLTGLTGWQELGRKLGEGVNGIFEKIDFVLMAQVITEGFRGILVSITELIAEIKFDEIVRKVNDGLQALYDGIKWDTIGGEITAFTTEVKKAFNDLMGLDFGLVGSIIGAGITDIVRAFNQLTGEDGLDFETLGSNISNGFRKMFEEIPWTELGHALGNGFMIGWRILDGFITDMSAKNDAGLTGWQELGTSLGNAVNGIFAKINFSDIASVLVGGINGAIDALWNFVETIEWGDLANNISTGLNKMITGIHWKDAGIAVNNLIGEFLGMLLQAAQETDWESLGRNIGTFLGQIDWLTHLGTAWEIVKEVFGGLIDGLKETLPGRIILTLVETIGSLNLAASLGPVLTTALGTVFGPAGAVVGIIATAIIALGPTLLNLGGDIMKGILNGIKAVALGIGGWIKEHIVDPIVGWVKKLFGIHSPSTVMAEIGGYVIEGLLVGLKDNVGGVLDWFSKLPQNVKDKLGNAREWLKEKGKNAIEGIKDGWESAKQGKFLNLVSKIAGEARTAIGDIKGKVRDKGADIIGGLKSGLDGAWRNLSSALGGLGDKVKRALPDFSSIGRKAMQGLSDGFKSIGIKLPHIEVSWNQHTAFGNNFSTPSFGIKWYAKGGYAYKPSVVGIGEAGDEAILPLENSRTMGMIADRIMNNYSGGGFGKENIVDAIVEGVATAMMMNQSNQPPIRVDSYVELRTENETLARAVAKGQQSIDYRTNPTPQFG